MNATDAQLILNIAGQAIPIATGAVGGVIALIQQYREQAAANGVVFDDAALDKVIAEADVAAARRRSEAHPPLAEGD